MKHIREGKDKDHLDPIDLAYTYNKDEHKDPILEWLQENREPVLDEECSKPSLRIAIEISIDVEEYTSSSWHSHNRTPWDNDEGHGGGNGIPYAIEEPQRESERLLSPFTGDDAFTHATQDEHHGV